MRCGKLIAVMLIVCSGSAASALGDDSAALGGPSVVPGAESAKSGASAAAKDAATDMTAMQTAKPTIVQRNFQGEVALIEDQRIEVAAVRALKLDDATKAKVDELLRARATLTSKLTLSHYDKFIALQGMFASGEPASAEARRERQTAVREMRELVKPLIEPSLMDGLAAEVGEQHATVLRAMVEEYRDATKDIRAKRGGGSVGRDSGGAPGAVKEDVREGVDSEKGNASGTLRGRLAQRQQRGANEGRRQIEETLEVLREMGRSFKTFVEERRDRFESLLAVVNASPEQRAQIDKIISKDGDLAKLQPTEEQRGRMMREVMKVLTAEQQKILAEERGK